MNQDEKIAFNLYAGQALASAVLKMLNECPFDIDEATIPKAGIDAAPNQVVGRCSMSVARRRLLKELADQIGIRR